MKRFALSIAVIAASVLWCGPAMLAQTGNKIYRLGVLSPSPLSLPAFRDALRALGYIEGRNLVIDARDGPVDALPRLASELVALRPDAIFAVTTLAVRAAQKATSTVPIVAFGNEDALAPGSAMSLARPSGNVTGVVILLATLDAKRLDLLHEAVGPAARRIAALLVTNAPIHEATEQAMRAVAASAGFELLVFDAAGPDDYPAAFAAIRAARVQALLIGASAILYRDAGAIIALAGEARLPTACEWSDMARQGCLIGYGPDRRELYRQAANYVSRVLNGAAPGELPIQQPTRFEMAINLKTAKALGLAVPPAILARADEVIE